MKQVRWGQTSCVEVMRDEGVVVKTTEKHLEYGVVSREAEWLLKAQTLPCSRAPRIYGRAGDTLTLEYRGEPVTPETLPDDWREQAEEILAFLAHMDCAHNDIKPSDLVVNDKGRITLLDYQWATRAGDPLPDEWPDCLGDPYRAPHGHDDRWSLFHSLQEVADGAA